MDNESLSQIRLIEPIKYTFMACTAILYFDYILTFPAEVERFWVLKLTWGSFFFFLSRYFVLVGWIAVLFGFFGDFNVSHCTGMKKYHDLFTGAGQVIVSTLMIMRTYALYNKSRNVLAILVSIGLVTLALGVWAILTRSIPVETSNLPGLECFPSMTAETAYRFIGAWSGVVVLDGSIFVLTLTKAIRMRITGFTTLLDIMFRDGTIYFAVLTMSNLANILTYVLGGPFIRGINANLSTILSSVLMSRLMLSIRDPKLRIRMIESEPGAPAFSMGLITRQTRSTRTETTGDVERTFDIGAVPWGVIQGPTIGFVHSPPSVGDVPRHK